MIGLSEDSQQAELVVAQDENTAIKYQVVEQTLDLNALRQELDMLENPMPKPTDQELVELGKMHHPYYMQPDNSVRIAEIKSILGE